MVEKGASKLAINPKTDLIYVANTGNDTVSMIRDDSSSNIAGIYVKNLKRFLPIPLTTNFLHSVENVTVGKQPSGIAVNPTTNKIYVANTGSNTVSVIKADDSNLHNTTNLKVGIKPNDIAVDPTTNKIYVANTGSNTISVIDGKTDNNSTVKTIPVGKTHVRSYSYGLIDVSCYSVMVYR